MSVYHNNITWIGRGLWANDIQTVSADFNENDYVRSDSINDAPHHRGTAILHPSKDYLMENRILDVLVTGGWEVSWDWDPGDFTEAQVDDWLANHPMPDNWTTVKDWANHRVYSTCSDVNYRIDDWESQQVDYYLKAANSQIKCTSQGKFFCVNLLNRTYTDYTMEVRTIEPNSTLTVEKTGTDCFFTPMDICFVGDRELVGMQTYKLTSDSIDVTNDSGDRMKIIRIHK